MTPGTWAAWVAGLLTLLVAGVTVAALWPAPRPGRRRAPRAAVATRAIAVAVEDPTEDLDWDGFLRDLTPHFVDAPTVELGELGLRAEQIQIPRDGETK